jgi:hypothetical protein
MRIKKNKRGSKMKTVTKEYQVYEFSELSDEVKEKVIRKWYENEDYSFLPEDLQNALENHPDNIFSKGFELSYSLGSSQGDGLCIKGKIDLKKYLEIEYPALSTEEKEALTDQYLVYSTGNKGRYTYASTQDIDYDYNDPDGIRSELFEDKIIANMRNHYLFLCKEIEKDGYNMLEYRMSNEEFSDLCEENWYNFLENGKMVNY